MAITLNGTVDAATRARFETLDRVNHDGAQALADRYNSGDLNASAFDREVTASLVSFKDITSANSGLSASAARFGTIIPFRSEPLPPTAVIAMDETNLLPGVSGEGVLAKRGNIVSLIGDAIRPS